ncbi:Nuclear hormone receptor, ligand-binding, core domain and Zinc finger, nuclear hormone receptor-type domain and Nuclear hormone receptor, ligand-binding domain-containing protein [Strongyloides ratti]|uniref:Nuclear hormone receptor, ligand-binding, core domain and Zinc finger, nuclear hormone receptor-type domain and Nuclear hormone receptor, ligand-binding domain-containing protein n=1 Tax=Strongyloides ratti TaxID=34506 RepID=A0A090LIY5_STRRB|nr:Nuclear hormone receptor, ligand-binding, core domain and Zinc finger, nuclear hormone receptor-type domain and Nuclear hormone receptor, ligand-binding domain-containing protein [Strongyloides ratti]CEF69762.1 Nuclear hormone receptor, ligand-binding, core domain and Zinc finger, nuclear hormone receptor-type domain and Nuclear hormone receptor, ligand-binding domain-containing protein [Strongyloides ratti]
MITNKVNNIEECLVCTAVTNSAHCSVNSCRSCSAFFRRSALGNYIYRCRRGNKQCQIKPKDKLFCKYCRYEKCKAVGMIIRKNNNKNSQEIILNKISSSNTPQNTNIEPSTSNNEHLPSSKPITERYQIVKNQLIFDIQETKNLIKKIFENKMYGCTHIEGFQLTCLQKVIQGIEYMKNKLNIGSREEISIHTKVEFKKYLRFWEKFIIYSAEMLMHIPDFASLPNDEKFEIYRNFYPMGYILFRVYYSVLIFSVNNETMLIVDENIAHPIDNFNIIDLKMTDVIAKKFDDMTKPFTQFLDIHVFQPMKLLKLENIEIAYLIIQMVFSNVNNEKLFIESRPIFDKILKVTNDELHNYYYYNKKITNYAYRITEMTKLLSTLKEYSIREREIILVAKWLNIFDLSVLDKF